MIDSADPLYREALHALALDVARRLLDLGVPPEEIVLRGDGFTITIALSYKEEQKCQLKI